ncbi:MAG: hypothetical protein IPH52_12045 [Leptospiraceae bacterium]|nr:hypothetical protein [Leptospiraceae bacterium]
MTFYHDKINLNYAEGYYYNGIKKRSVKKKSQISKDNTTKLKNENGKFIHRRNEKMDYIFPPSL